MTIANANWQAAELWERANRVDQRKRTLSSLDVEHDLKRLASCPFWDARSRFIFRRKIMPKEDRR